MATTIKLKNSVTATNAPSSLVQGEVAINVTDKKVWVGNAATTPIQLLGGGADGSFTNISVSSVATFGAGTVSLPAITTTGDTNTGIFFPAADTIAFTEGGVESMRIDSSGNVGIGLTPPVGSGNYRSLNLGATFIYGNTGLAVAAYNNNADINDKYIITGVASSYTQSSGNHIWYNAASGSAGASISFTERMRIDSSGNVGIGTSSPRVIGGGYRGLEIGNASGVSIYLTTTSDTYRGYLAVDSGGTNLTSVTAHPLVFGTNNAERMRILSNGNVLFNNTTASATSNMMYYAIDDPNNGHLMVANTSATDNLALIYCNRQTSDGKLMEFRQANNAEGTISVSGSTVSYNGGHLSRWSQLPDGSKDDTILKGTVLSNLDDMCVWTKDGTVLDNEQLNKMKVSDVEGDTNVAGVFVNWTIDEQCNTDDMNVAMTGDMIIRIADGVVVQKGDLLMSAGDGTAKPQGDDIRRSKTVAKVTSNHVTCTYADGSYCVPCVLMAC
jgi:hypothetical protein